MKWILTILSLTSISAFANEFPDISSGRVSVERAVTDLPADGRPWFVRAVSGAPTGAPSRANRTECSAAAFEDLVTSMNDNLDSTAVLQRKFDACEKHLKRFSTAKVIQVIKFAAVAYKLQKHKLIREVRLKFGNSLNRKALVGLKQGRRPLIVYQCGLFCDIYGLESKIMMMQLYDGTPFHVLVVGSVSGKEFVEEHGQLSLGGFDEALQIMDLFKLLRDPNEPLSKYISSIHLVGSSLGSHAVLYSTLYSSFMTETPIQSAIALCPVVNYKDAVEHLAYDGGYAQGLGTGAWSMLRENFAQSSDPEIQKMATWELKRMPEAIQEAGFKQYGNKVPWLPAPLESYVVRSREDFWNVGYFGRYASQIRVPLFAWASEDDPVVLAKKNLKTLAPSDHLRILFTKSGLHCLTGAYYGWDVQTAILKGTILAHSPEFTSGRSSRSHALKKAPELYDGETYFSYEWAAKKKDLRLIYKIWSPSKRQGQDLCGRWDPYYAFEGCFRRAEVAIPYSALEGADVFTPSNSAESESLTRWANANLRVSDGRGSDLHHTRHAPSSIIWSIY
ncbi:MAG: hypothetical protein ABL958_09235 [Bdellovibrionia bacterium]